MNAKLSRWAIIFVSGALVVTSFAASIFAQDLGPSGIGGRPAFPREDNPRSESIFVHTLNPGESVDDGVNVINNTENTRTIDVYETDSVFSSGGAFACAQKVDDREDVGAWITLAKNQVTLDGGTNEVIPFTIDVPSNADVGEHNGCIVIEGGEESNNTDEGIALSFRTAIRVAVLIPGEIEKSLEITGFSGSTTTDNVTLNAMITNTGNVSVDTDIQTTLSYPFGVELTTTEGNFPVLRDQIGEWNFDHPRPFWGGLIKAKIVASYDPNPDNFLGDETSEVETLTYPDIWIWVWPQPLALAIKATALLLVGYFIFMWLKRRKEVKNWTTYTVKQGGDIKTIAKATGTSWKMIAKVNKLKAPYTLKAGQKIKAPKRK